MVISIYKWIEENCTVLQDISGSYNVTIENSEVIYSELYEIVEETGITSWHCHCKCGKAFLPEEEYSWKIPEELIEHIKKFHGDELK